MSLEEYEEELIRRDVTEGTKKLYMKNIKDFLNYAQDQEVNQELINEYKKDMLDKFKATTVNTKVTILNNYLEFMEKDILIKLEKIQRNNVLDNVLNENEYQRIIKKAREKGEERTRIVMVILHDMGIRVSELTFLTVEALKQGYADITNKGKTRRVSIPNKLSKELKEYVKSEGIEEGYIIRNKNGEPLSRSYIFRQIKWIGGQARGIKLSKIYPHSLRHLFAKNYLKNNNDNVLALADILGHSNLETTRIYTTLSTNEQRDSMNF